MSGQSPERTPERVRVTGPPRRTTVPPATRAADIDAGTRLGEVYLRSLLRDQFWLAMRIGALLVVVIGGLPLLFHLVPGLAHVSLAGIPLPWLLLGVAVYPFLFVLGWHYVRRAEQHEDRFVELLSAEAEEDR